MGRSHPFSDTRPARAVELGRSLPLRLSGFSCPQRKCDKEGERNQNDHGAWARSFNTNRFRPMGEKNSPSTEEGDGPRRPLRCAARPKSSSFSLADYFTKCTIATSLSLPANPRETARSKNRQPKILVIRGRAGSIPRGNREPLDEGTSSRAKEESAFRNRSG
jgi:hypothetical protein